MNIGCLLLSIDCLWYTAQIRTKLVGGRSDTCVERRGGVFPGMLSFDRVLYGTLTKPETDQHVLFFLTYFQIWPGSLLVTFVSVCCKIKTRKKLSDALFFK